MLEVSASLIAPIGHSGTQLPQPMHAPWLMYRKGLVTGAFSWAEPADRPSAAALAAVPVMNWRRSMLTPGSPIRSMPSRGVPEKTDPGAAEESRSPLRPRYHRPAIAHPRAEGEFMDIYIDYGRRVDKVTQALEDRGIDLFLGTRGKSVNYIGGAFIPWRSVVVISKEGSVGLNTLLMDAERIKVDSWLDNITACAPLPGLELWDITVQQIRELGFAGATIGVELGHSPRMIEGYLFATEYEYLKNELPDASFVNALDVMDLVTLVKEPAEIQLMRQASAIADAAQERVMESLEVGMTEMEIAGIGELEMRRLGSEFHWPVTGSSEVASGYRSWYPLGGCTPPTDKILQRGENLLVDMHPTYKQYYSDLSHNYILGKPSQAQQKLADAYLRTCETLIGAFKAGTTVGEIFRTVKAEVEATGYDAYTLPGFGHGLGVVGHEWFPAIIDNDEFRDVVLEENVVEVAAVVMNVPDVGGMRLEVPVRVTPQGGEMLASTPLELTVLDL
jgi:Xaa-Pro aminopeptidase